MSFLQLGLPQSILNILSKLNFSEAYPIQKEAIPVVLKKQDLLGIAKTGSGKTASYVLPILSNLQDSKEAKNRHAKALVLVPTRELAVQIEAVFKSFSIDLEKRIKTVAIFGGVAINPQMQALQGAEIVIATPGRLIELEEANAINISEIETLVLDEADKMLNLGFKDEMDQIFSRLPKKRQNLLFSATLSPEVQKVEKLLLHNPQIIKIDEDKDPLDLIQQLAYYVDDENKGPLLRHLIESKDMHQVLVFTASAKRADWVANKLRANGIDARPIHSKKSQGARMDLLTKFKYKHLRVLVSTDLLARGIDIEFLPYVINYELPRSPKDFVHRIGRTGRAENPGEALSLITPDEEHHFRVIQKKMKKWVTRVDGNEVLFKS